MNENQKKFMKLWDHARLGRDNELSLCMLAIKEALLEVLGADKIDLRNLLPTQHRIVFYNPDSKWEFYNTAMVLQVDGEWKINNADLMFWGDLSFFGGRDYFPDKWRWMSSGICGAIYQKRRWQTLERYKNCGLRHEHIKLLAKMGWRIDYGRGDWVSLYVEGKRPFGNSCIEGDMFDALGWEIDWEKYEEEGYSPDIIEQAWELFDELEFAITDVFKQAKEKGEKTNGSSS